MQPFFWSGYFVNPQVTAQAAGYPKTVRLRRPGSDNRTYEPFSNSFLGGFGFDKLFDLLAVFRH